MITRLTQENFTITRLLKFSKAGEEKEILRSSTLVVSR